MFGYFLLQIPVVILSLALMYFPQTRELPFGGDVYLTQAVGYAKFVFVMFPPLTLLWEAFIWVIGFKIGMKLFLMLPFVGRLFRH